MTSPARRTALEAAVAGLPTSLDEPAGWSVPPSSLKAAGLTDGEEARKAIVAFAQWARGAVGTLPTVRPELCEATDFNDYYKLVMSRVQYIYAQAGAGSAAGAPPDTPLCQFQTQLRRRPVVLVGGEPKTLGVFDAGEQPDLLGSFDAHAAPFRAAVAAVGARRFSKATLLSLLEQAKTLPPFAAIEASLASLSTEWVEALSDQPLFTLLPEGVDFSRGPSCEVKLCVVEGRAVLLAQGPWFRVTFAETAMLQVWRRPSPQRRSPLPSPSLPPCRTFPRRAR